MRRAKVWLLSPIIMGAFACAGGARNPFGDEAITSVSVGHPGGTGETDDGGAATDSVDSGSASSPTGGSGTATDGPDETGSASAAESGPGAPCEQDADCDDGDACTQDSCDPVLGCTASPVDCDDGDACTIDDCDPIAGCQHDPVVCDDGVDCTQDSCEPGTGQCIHAPDDGACSDGNACNGIESCDAGSGCLAGTPVVCNDGNACTQDMCDPGSGQCSHPAVVSCTNNDGCCPVGCSVANDNDCVCNNLAGSATASSSGGGTNGTGYGPLNLNDGFTKAQCVASGCNQCFAWISNSSSSSGWFQLEWANTMTIGSIYVEGEHVSNPSCGSSGRNLAAGSVQWWNGNAWVTATSWGGNVENLFFEFNPPLQTNRIRLANVTSGAGNGNSMAFEWYVYQPLGCTP